MKAVLSVALLGLFASANVCYPYKCGSLEQEDECAHLSDGVITINKDGCNDSDLICSVSEAYKYFIDEEIDSGSYSCIEDTSDEIDEILEEQFGKWDSSDWAKSTLCEYDVTMEFADSIPDKDAYQLCHSDESCLLVNGATTKCVCGLDGTAFCTPEWGSSFFSEWYRLCRENEANLVYYKYFLFKSTFISYILTVDESEDYECFSEIAIEGQLWDEAVSDYEDEKGGGGDDDDKEDDGDDDGAIKLIVGSLVGLLLLA